MRIQEENEPVDAFITDLYALAEHCGYGNLHEEMIRDRIVVGLQDASLSEKLQLDADLTLAKAVDKVRQAEAVKKQQAVIRNDRNSAPNRKGQTRWPKKPGIHRRPATPAGGKPCYWCGCHLSELHEERPLI